MLLSFINFFWGCIHNSKTSGTDNLTFSSTDHFSIWIHMAPGPMAPFTNSLPSPCCLYVTLNFLSNGLQGYHEIILLKHFYFFSLNTLYSLLLDEEHVHAALTKGAETPDTSYSKLFFAL